MTDYFIGIDPGVSGGVAVISTSDISTPRVWKCPPTERDAFILLKEIVGLRSPVRTSRRFFAVVEWIHPAIQGIGKSAMSKLYGNYSMWRAYLTALGIPFEAVMAKDWQPMVGVRRRGKSETQSKWKNRLKAKAQMLFPDVDVTLATADAILIAEFCRRQRQVHTDT